MISLISRGEGKAVRRDDLAQERRPEYEPEVRDGPPRREEIAAPNANGEASSSEPPGIDPHTQEGRV